MQPGPLTTGGLRPLSVLTGHQAPGFMGGGADETGGADPALQRQLLEIDAAIGRAQAAAAEANLQLEQLLEVRENLIAAQGGA